VLARDRAIRYASIWSMLPVESAGLLVGLTWMLVGLFGAVVLRWEKTSITEARRAELEAEGPERVSVGIRVWRLAMNAMLIGIPLFFAVDGLVDSFGILYEPALSFLAGPDIVLQIAGIVAAVLGLALLVGLGRKLAVNVYRLAVEERRMMTTGFHRYIRHPFYIHFYLLPLSSFLISLNYLALLLFVPYTMLEEPKPLTAWMREEEEDLRRRYGAEGEAYLGRTGRFIPRLRRR
jgi:protein-S-isoprenylcysteine O-methyltransferase Ste14